ncbi:MAG: SdrD B-like domain-containing protein [Actinomycetota bacterium]|nr:SdrD B-like domain-containing protein [Actinomycetota bacterium]MDD5666451.1 SdrD B-like domain-containing protein [Actinomycetota bacterium]
MSKTTRWLAFVSVTALVLLSLLGGVVSATAGNGGAPDAAQETLMAEGLQDVEVKGEAPVEDGSGGTPPQAGVLCAEGRICVIKFLDGNENGVMDAEEQGLSGVTITLNGANPKQTGSDGKVCYDDLSGGTYTVSETVPDGYYATTPTSYTLDISWNEKVTVYFGNAPDEPLKGSISGHKYDDVDGSGAYSEGDLPLGGVTIELWSGGVIAATATTAADGSYSFGDLEPGDYTVKEIVPAGTEATSPASVDVTVAEGQDVTGVDFFNKDKDRVCDDGVIEALVRVDEDCDGEFTWDDPLLDGVTIRLYHIEENDDLTPVSPPSMITGPGWGFQVLIITLPVYYPGGHVIWEGLPRAYGGSDTEARYRVVMETPAGYTAKSPTEVDVVLHNCPWPCWWQCVYFLLSPNSHLRGHKYEDVNSNGVYDAGTDVPLEGWTIELYDDQGALIATTTTNAAGEYSFDGLPEGLYTVKEVLQAGWRCTYPEGGIYVDVPVGTGDVDGKDFLNARDLSISGHKFEDADCDGEIGAEDPGVPGVEVQLFIWNEVSGEYEYVASTLTGAGGYYEFTGLKPGTYKVREALTAGMLEDWYIVSPDGGVYDPVVLTDADVEDLDFLNARYGAIEGWKYWDKDENGIMDGDDEGLAGVTIMLDPDPDIGAPQVTVTDADGYFYFGHLLPGKYTVSVDESTVPDYYPLSPVTVEVDVVCGVTVKVYFSEAPYGSISGKKWLDADYDGVWDEEEAEFIAGITINLYEGSPPGDLIASAVTGEDGYFEFTHLEPGTYTLVETEKEGYFYCTPVNVTVVLSAGEGAVVNFGNCPYGRVEGLKFDDLDGDGSFDPGEPTLAGIEVTLEGLGDIAFLATTVTGEDGTFVFNDLKPGQYAVSEKVPPGYYATRPILVEVTVGPGESISVIFSNTLYGKIIANKWLDDGDLLLDKEKDKPKAGMPLRLTGKTLSGELVSIDAETEEDGSYAFLLLEAGEYNVTEFFDSTKMKAVTPESVDVTLPPGGEEAVDFLNVEVEVLPQPPIRPDTLPMTGMNQLPLILTAAVLMVIGLFFLALGLRRRYQE